MSPGPDAPSLRGLSCLLVVLLTSSAGAWSQELNPSNGSASSMPPARRQDPSAEDPSASFLERVAQVLSPRLRRLSEQRAELLRQLSAWPRPGSPTSESLGFHSRLSASPNSTEWVQVDLGADLLMDAVALVPAHVPGETHPGAGYGFPGRFRVETAGDAAFAQPHLLADYTGEDFPNPGNAPLVIETPGHRARFVRLTATRLWQGGQQCVLALGELLVLAGERNTALNRPVTASDSTLTLPQWSPANLVDGQSVLGLPVDAERSPANGYHSFEHEMQQSAVKWVQVDLGQPRSIDEIRLIPARPRDWALIPGFGFPLRFRVESSLDPDLRNPTVLRPEDTEDMRNPGDNLVTISCPGVVARVIRVTATKLWLRGDYHAFALAELQAWRGSTNVALGGRVSALDSVEYGFWSTNALVDGFASQQRLVDFSSWLRRLGQMSQVEAALRALETKRTQLTREVLVAAGRWSLGVVAALVLAVAALAYRYRLLRALELERLRTRIATDLHDELGTRLTRIGLVADLAERETGSAHPAHLHLTQISGMTRELVRTMDEIVWAVNPRNDTLDDLANYVFHFAQEFFRDTPVRCRLDVPTDLPPLRLTPELRHNLFLAVKEAINNLLKHARAENALVRFQLDDGVLTLGVEDDGAGFDLSGARPHGNGLRNMRQRMASIGGRLDCQSQPGKGTRVLFQVKLMS